MSTGQTHVFKQTPKFFQETKKQIHGVLERKMEGGQGDDNSLLINL